MKKILLIIIIFFCVISYTNQIKARYIVNLIGVWEGTNKSYSTEKGYRTWNKKISIFEQNERIFKGIFKYTGGERNFIGVIRSNNKIFYWVSPEGKGYIHGEILNKNTIEACYIEVYKGAAVGCSILKKQK